MRAGRQGFESRPGHEFFSLPPRPDGFWDALSFLSSGVWREALSSGLKRPEDEANSYLH